MGQLNIQISIQLSRKFQEQEFLRRLQWFLCEKKLDQYNRRYGLAILLQESPFFTNLNIFNAF